MQKKMITFFSLFVCLLFLSSCKESKDTVTIFDAPDSKPTEVATALADEPVASSKNTSTQGTRDNVPVCLVPSADAVTVYENESAVLDASNTSEGYVMVNYIGSSKKVKLQITGPNQITYTYSLNGGYETFPLASGNGDYFIAVYENITGNQYATAFSQDLTVSLKDEFRPYLYPNQYVDFTSTSLTVSKGAELSASANSDLDAITNIYNYVIHNISYDYNKAETVQSGYTSKVDDILTSGTGICLDYAAVMASMLRSQRIPTRLEVGYAGEAYHAWISTYITEVGWVNGMIEFDGKSWKLMDPTFAANSSEETLRNFIGNGSNYTTKYIY